MAAAEERKAEVRYPACSRPVKHVAFGAKRRVGPLKKLALAFAGGALVRGLLFALKAADGKLGAFARLWGTAFAAPLLKLKK